MLQLFLPQTTPFPWSMAALPLQRSLPCWKHRLAGLHSLWVNTHTLPEIQPALHSQLMDRPWEAKGLPTPWFHTQQDIGKITLSFPPIIPRSGLTPVQGTWQSHR